MDNCICYTISTTGLVTLKVSLFSGLREFSCMKKTDGWMNRAILIGDSQEYKCSN